MSVEHPRDSPASKPDSDGPEWWAMGAEPCKCGHRLDDHEDTWNAKYGSATPCRYSKPTDLGLFFCTCPDFQSEEADNPS